MISPGEGTVVGRAALTKQVARIDNSWNDPLYEKKRDAKIGGVRSMIGVPLLREGETIGVIALARNRVEPFTDRETELVATFAKQVVIAIENVRLFEAEQQRTRELSEALEQQTATCGGTAIISSFARRTDSRCFRCHTETRWFGSARQDTATWSIRWDEKGLQLRRSPMSQRRMPNTQLSPEFRPSAKYRTIDRIRRVKVSFTFTDYLGRASLP